MALPIRSTLLASLAALVATTSFAQGRSMKAVKRSTPDRNVNISLNPLALSLGSLDVGAEFKISDKVSLGPYGRYSLDRDDGKLIQDGLGVRADFALSGRTFHSGWYLSPFISRYSFKMKNVTIADDTATSGNSSNTAKSASKVASDWDFTSLNVGATAGYGWFWRPGINLRLGAGLMHSTIDGQFGLSSDDSSLLTPSKTTSGFLPTGDLILAWAF